MGLITFLLSGLLGTVLLFRSPVAPEAAFQNLMPAFVGLFTVPWLILNLVGRTSVPPQTVSSFSRLTPGQWASGTLAGALGGGFAALFPVVTGGIGSLLAGHATSQRDDRAFLVSQGTARVVYYTGGFLLLFVPGLHLTRGGAAWLLRGLYVPHGRPDFALCVAAVALAGAASLLLAAPVSRLVLGATARWGYRRLTAFSFAVSIALVAGMTGIPGLCVMVVAGAIGLLPVLYGARRMNCLGVILLPMACNMSGVGARLAGWLGLL
jgi:putative membrane protein